MKLFSGLSPAIVKETRYIAVFEAAAVVVMYIVFAVLHAVMPDKVPFDYRVILGGLGGGIIAVANIYLLGRTVQKISETEDQKLAAVYMKASYKRRMLLQMAWGVVAIAAPVFQFAAGLIPLLFPSIAAKLRAVLLKDQDTNKTA